LIAVTVACQPLVQICGYGAIQKHACTHRQWCSPRDTQPPRTTHLPRSIFSREEYALEHSVRSQCVSRRRTQGRVNPACQLLRPIPAGLARTAAAAALRSRRSPRRPPRAWSDLCSRSCSCPCSCRRRLSRGGVGGTSARAGESQGAARPPSAPQSALRFGSQHADHKSRHLRLLFAASCDHINSAC
jgi:hypothetical protein